MTAARVFISNRSGTGTEKKSGFAVNRRPTHQDRFLFYKGGEALVARLSERLGSTLCDTKRVLHSEFRAAKDWYGYIFEFRRRGYH